MIRINDRFSILRDENGWTLYEFSAPGVFRGVVGKKPRVRERYYSQLSHMIAAMVDLAPTEAKTLDEVVESMKQINADIRATLGLDSVGMAWVEPVEGGGE